MGTTQELLDERFGRRRSPLARWAIAGGAVLALGAVGAFAWLTIANSLDAVDVDTTSFTVVDTRTIEVGFQVSAPAGAAVACALEAQDVEHGVVGWRVIELPPSDTFTRAFREVVPTVAEATTGFVNSCWVT